MTRPVRLPRRLAVALALASLAGCGGPPAVSLAGEWPDRAHDYRDVTRAWTRRGEVRQGWDQVLEVYATYKSPAWRTAYVQRRMALEKLPAGERQALVDAQKQAAAAHHELELLVTTYEGRENDLAKHPRSTWRLALVDAGGRQVEPISIERDRRPRDVIQAEFPAMGDFARAYVVKFPADLAILGQGASRFSLVISSPRGAAELEWRGAR